MTKARIREIRAYQKVIRGPLQAGGGIAAKIIEELLAEVEEFNRRARRGEDLSTDAQELPLAAKVNPPKKAKGEQIDIVDYANEIGLSDDDAEWFWLKMNENDWKVGKQPVKDWKARMRQWKLMQIFPSQKNQPRPAAQHSGPVRTSL